MNYKDLKNAAPLQFVLLFLGLFLAFYYFNILFFGFTTPGNNYCAFLDEHLNYIRGLRHFLLGNSARILNLLGFTTLTDDSELLLVGHGTIRLIYSCLGLGVISFFTAFVLAYPGKWRPKLLFIIAGIIAIELLNIVRFVLLSLYWHKHYGKIIDHHLIFNTIIYIIVSVSLYFWVKHTDSQNKTNAPN